MNLLRLPVLLLAAANAFFIGASAQSAQSYRTDEAWVASAAANSNKVSVHSEIPSAYRFHKKMPLTYSGFAIEVAASNYPLKRDNPVFRQFGNVFYEKLAEGGYSYLVKSEFSSREAALHFVNTIILPKAPEARLFEYKEGVRKVVRE